MFDYLSPKIYLSLEYYCVNYHQKQLNVESNTRLVFVLALLHSDGHGLKNAR